MNNVVMESEIHNGDCTIQNRCRITVMNKLDSTVQEASVCAMSWLKKNRVQRRKEIIENQKKCFSLSNIISSSISKEQIRTAN